ncbi:MAG: hypothetical protein AB7U23_14990 [Dehalococcoidia bacterium]
MLGRSQENRRFSALQKNFDPTSSLDPLTLASLNLAMLRISEHFSEADPYLALEPIDSIWGRGIWQLTMDGYLLGRIELNNETQQRRFSGSEEEFQVHCAMAGIGVRDICVKGLSLGDWEYWPPDSLRKVLQSRIVDVGRPMLEKYAKYVQDNPLSKSIALSGVVGFQIAFLEDMLLRARTDTTLIADMEELVDTQEIIAFMRLLTLRGVHDLSERMHLVVQAVDAGWESPWKNR